MKLNQGLFIFNIVDYQSFGILHFYKLRWIVSYKGQCGLVSYIVDIVNTLCAQGL